MIQFVDISDVVGYVVMIQFVDISEVVGYIISGKIGACNDFNLILI